MHYFEIKKIENFWIAPPQTLTRLGGDTSPKPLPLGAFGTSILAPRRSTPLLLANRTLTIPVLQRDAASYKKKDV